MIQIVAKAIAAPLKEDGFRKKALTWNRSRDGVVHVVDLQKSRFSEPGTADVTLNIGVLIEPVWRTCWDKELPKWVKEEECFPRFRIGELLGGFSGKSTDQWWSAVDSEQAVRIGSELEDIVRTKVLPFLGSLQTVAAIKEFVDKHTSVVSQPADKISLAILAHQTGARSQCDQLLREFEDEKLRAWRNRVEGVKSRLQAVS